MRSAALLLSLTLCDWCGLADEPRKFEPAKAEKTLLDLINKERRRADVPPLEPSALLFKIAKAHSAGMAKLKQPAQIVDGKKATERLKEAGFTFTGAVVGHGDSVATVWKSWMDQESVRKIVLNPKFTQTGLGFVTTKDGLFCTQLLGTPKK